MKTLLQENFFNRGPSEGKKLYGRGSRGKNSFQKFPLPLPQIFNGRPLIKGIIMEVLLLEVNDDNALTMCFTKCSVLDYKVE